MAEFPAFAVMFLKALTQVVGPCGVKGAAGAAQLLPCQSAESRRIPGPGNHGSPSFKLCEAETQGLPRLSRAPLCFGSETTTLVIQRKKAAIFMTAEVC